MHRNLTLFLAILGLVAQPACATAAEAVSFLNDVVPIFTRFGCNQGACHGKGSGQNGFRLSLRGYAPELDHFTLTREYLGRRCDPTQPENSLLLRKAVGVAAHEGGKIFTPDDRAYGILRDWIAQGASGPRKDDLRLDALTVQASRTQLKPGESGQLQVEARYSDGSVRDVTWLAKYDSNDAGLIAVDAHGRFEVQRHGETSVRVSYGTLVSVVVLTAPHANPVDPSRFPKPANAIDAAVFNRLKALRIEPSDLCTDEAFLRRAFLDTLGVLPTPDEIRAFVSDQRPDKRARLVDALLERPEFVDHWALFLGDLLQNRKERDHDVRGTKGVRAFHQWLREQVSKNRPWDELAREILTVQGSTAEHPAVGYFIVTVGEHNDAHRSEVVASVAQSFLGTRIGCAQCHNHPLEKYTQDDYYHFAGFFSRVRLERKDPKEGVTNLKVGLRDNRKGPIGVNQPRTGQFLAPRPLDRSPVTLEAEGDPRLALAQWITDPANEYFAGAMANRLWRHFLGVGLVEPVDDLRASNPPTNPELWKVLVTEFVGKKYDLKHLMRLILNSQTYQLSSATRPGNETDTRFYSHYTARRLPAEVLLDALASATGVPDEFPGYPVGIRAGQLPDPTLKNYFLGTFGRSERVTACACERNGEVTLPQLLHLMNGTSVVDRIRRSEGRLAKLLAGNHKPEVVIEELFLATLSRRPTAAELQKIQPALATADSPEEGYRDLFWALLNAKEFSFNR